MTAITPAAPVIFKEYNAERQLSRHKGHLFLNYCAVILQEYKKVQFPAELNQFHSFHLASGAGGDAAQRTSVIHLWRNCISAPPLLKDSQLQ